MIACGLRAARAWGQSAPAALFGLFCAAAQRQRWESRLKAAATLALAASLWSAVAMGGAEGPVATAGTSSPTVVSLRLRDHFAIVVARINGIETPLVFDSGDESTVALQQNVLNETNALPLGESTKQQFVKGPVVNSEKFRISRLELGRAVFSDVTGRVDVHDPSYQATDVGQKGFLGTGLFKQYQVVLNYRKRTMTLIPKGGNEGPSETCRGTTVPFAPSKFPAEPVTEADTDLGKLLLWWDTGTPTSVMSKQFVDTAGSKQPGDRLTTRRLMLGSKDFGPWPFDVWDMTLPPRFSGFIGYNFFADHIVCFDFPGKQIVIGQ